MKIGDEEDIKNTSEGKVNLVGGEDEENPLTNDSSLAQAPQDNGEAFIDQFNGCPILKFQVINSQCNSFKIRFYICCNSQKLNQTNENHLSPTLLSRHELLPYRLAGSFY